MTSTLLGNTSTNTNASTTDQNQTTSATNFDATDANQQLAASLNNNSLLMRMAKQKGIQYAGQRGLMNSSIGAEASQRAMVDAAQTTAQQNTAAAQTAERDEQLFSYDQQNKATDFSNSLKTMSEQQKNDLQKLNAQTSATKDIAAQQQQYTLTNTAKQVAANTQGMYLDAINGLTSTFGDQVAAINASSMSAADKKNSINSLISANNSMLKFYQSTYQNMSTIKDDWVNVDVETLPTGTIAKVA